MEKLVTLSQGVRATSKSFSQSEITKGNRKFQTHGIWMVLRNRFYTISLIHGYFKPQNFLKILKISFYMFPLAVNGVCKRSLVHTTRD